MLVIALLMFVGLGLFNRSQAFLATPAYSSVEARSITVEVTFDGLMVFRKVGDHYEVGILDKDTAPGHDFRMVVGDHEFRSKKFAAGKKWSLGVMTASGRPKAPDVTARHSKACNRIQDTMDDEDLDHVFDFCWIMDLEKEFNGNHELKLIKGKLKPIILLNNGELYTKYKYDQLNRRPRPSGTSSNFGFVAETIALRVELEAGESLVLTIPGEEGFKLEAGGARHAGFYNAPPTMKYHRTREDSHFPFYYDLFKKENAGLGDDIEPTPGGRRPLNRYADLNPRSLDDTMRKRTFDRQACGASFLGKSNDPLE
jgi:hypothetical protein